MASHNKARKLIKEQRQRTQQRILDNNILLYLVSSTNSELNFSASQQIPLRLCRECSEPLCHKTMCINRKWENCFLAARYKTYFTLSMLIILAIVPDVMSQQLLRETESDALTTLNETYRNLSHSGILNRTEFVSEPTFKTMPSTNKILNSTHYNKFVGEMPGAGVSLNRNSLLRADNVLQRQLREKAKKDSLESIKMHILMRLNLKKLPNITKPIAVPQNILENFYKNYNASPLYSAPKRTDLYSSDEIQNEPEKNSSEPTLSSSDEKLFTEMQGDDPSAFGKEQIIHNVPFNEKQNFANQKYYGFSNINNDGEYESVLSHITSIYIFPERK